MAAQHRTIGRVYVGMKTTILILILTSTLCFGQNPRRREGVAAQLGLSEEQRPKVQAIIKEQREAMKDARKKHASQDEMKALQQKSRERLAGVLTPEQMQKWEAGVKRRKNQRKSEK